MQETVAQEALGVKAIVQVNEAVVRSELKELVRQSVEDTLNGLLEAEADRLCGAQLLRAELASEI